jgi:hypothetical protein
MVPNPSKQFPSTTIALCMYRPNEYFAGTYISQRRCPTRHGHRTKRWHIFPPAR